MQDVFQLLGVVVLRALMLLGPACACLPVLVQLTAAARFFGFDDKQRDSLLGGALMAAFFIVGAPAAIVVRTGCLHAGCLHTGCLSETACLRGASLFTDHA